ncbi:MAG: sugar phosphate nucleotidyltransferase [Actinomycetota bacterium]
MAEQVPVAILCGGRGTRLGMDSVPKGLVEIGGKPLLWHVMKLYASQGFSDFIFCLGYGADQIKEAFSGPQPWNITFFDTGLDTQTGGRVKRLSELVTSTFMVTYQDGLARIDLNDLLEHHRRTERHATITVARTQIPFGLVKIDDDEVVGFTEKPMMDDWVNGGFFVFEPEVMDYLEEDSVLENEPFEGLVAAGQMTAYRQEEFWICMDTYKDTLLLNDLWSKGAPWKVWQDDV